MPLAGLWWLGGSHRDTGEAQGVGDMGESWRLTTHLQGLIHNWRDGVQFTHREGLGGVSAGDQQFIEAHAGLP